MALKTENKAANLNIENYMQAVSEEVKSINGVSSMSGSFTDSLPGFKPAIKDGRPVRCRFAVPIKFRT